MNKYLFALLLFSLFSCTNRSVLNKLDEIKAIGNTDPIEALLMLDSLEDNAKSGSKYISSKYELLKIRLNDKAYNMPNSDAMIRILVPYFEKRGSVAEKQEMYYYAGSVYRDLQDTPRSIEFFLKSLNYANDKQCDSVLLRNAYSNLHYLHYMVQHYSEAAIMAEKELSATRALGFDETTPYLHIVAAYLALDSVKQVSSALDSVFHLINSSQNMDNADYQDCLVRILHGYSTIGNTAMTEKCLSLIDEEPISCFSPYKSLVYARYYDQSDKEDSAIVCCKHILDNESNNLYNMYDASKTLFMIYDKIGDINNAYKYAGMYMQLSDSIDFGKRQELAATINNEYKYNLDRKEEENLMEEKRKYKNMLTILSFSSILILCIGYIIHVQKRNTHLKKILNLASEVQRISEEESQLRMEIAQKEQKLCDMNIQNKSLIRLLHQSDFEENAEDVMNAIRRMITRGGTMQSKDWRQLYNAVDKLYPTFKDRVIKINSNCTEQQMQVCYLMRIGLSNTQIQSLTEIPRITVWRWTKRYELALSPDDIDE